ncbi:MAG: hypothetical protein IJH34_00600, partial [Romboutsia sp.]|nr:hypothetical protein [Romboutsia sp.]
SMYKDAENIIDVEDLQEVQKERTNLNNKEMRCLPHNEESFKCDDEDLSLFKQAIDSAPCSIKDGIFIPNLEDMSIKCLPAKIVFTEEVLSNRKHLEKCLSKVVFICTYNETVPEIRKFKNYIGIGIPFDVEGYCFLNILKESNIPLNIIIERDENNRCFNRYFMDKLMYNHNVVEINKRYRNNTKKSNDDFGIIPFERY